MQSEVINAKNIGNSKVKSALRDLKDMHRNPLIRPDHSPKTIDEAIALMNGIHISVVHMLKKIQAPSLTPTLGSVVTTFASGSVTAS